jgi:hypothetical protein
MKTPSNGNGTDANTDRVRRLVPETANENQRGVTVLGDISSAMADRVVSADRISARLRYPQPLAALDPPLQAFDSTTRGFLQAIEPDRWA